MIRSRFYAPALVLGTLLTGACATRTTTHPTSNSRSYSPVCDEGVAVYDDFSTVPYDYYEVAFITAEQNAVYASKNDMVAAMRKRAGEQGGNAIVVNSVANSKSTVKILGEALGTSSAERQGKAVAIFMPADSIRVKNACGHS